MDNQPTPIPLDYVRHSAAHVLALAALQLFPDAKIGLGPVTRDGYYYEFEFPRQIGWEDVKQIEAQMQLLIQQDLPFNQLVVPKEQAFQILLSKSQIYKAELLQAIGEDTVSFYKTGEDFIDLCRGPHVSSTGQIGAVKLVSLSTSYWQGDQSRPLLQKISGVAFGTKMELEQFLATQEEIKKRDFRRLAQETNLSLSGGEQVILTPSGSMVVQAIAQLVTKPLLSVGFSQIKCPPIMSLDQAFKAHDTYFGHKNRSYKELPVHVLTDSRYELEQSVIGGDKELKSVDLIAAKSFTSSDQQEILPVIVAVLKNLHLALPHSTVRITTPQLDSEFIGQITALLKQLGVSQTVVVDNSNQAVYINLIGMDSLDREWELAEWVLQPSRLQYISKLGEFTPAQELNFLFIPDKFLAFLLEDTNGSLPAWLTPQQVRVIPITDNQVEYADNLAADLQTQGFRTGTDARAETMQSKIRDAEIARVPFIVIVGEKEVSSNTVSLRLRGNDETGLLSLPELSTKLQELSKTPIE